MTSCFLNRSGDAVLADIRKHFTVPVIVISAKETTQNKIDLLRLGADDYITKPFDMEEVLARIESNLRRVQFQAEPQEYFEHDGLILDRGKILQTYREGNCCLRQRSLQSWSC